MAKSFINSSRQYQSLLLKRPIPLFGRAELATEFAQFLSAPVGHIVYFIVPRTLASSLVLALLMAPLLLYINLNRIFKRCKS
jgi:hypothetical protein